MRNRIGFLAAVLLLIPCACGSDEESGPSPVQECDRYVEASCRHITDCTMGNISRQACLTELRSIFDCSKAIRITGSMDRCVSEIAEGSCQALADDDPSNDLPLSCRNIVEVSE